MKKEKSLQWKGFVKDVGLSRKRNIEGVVDDKSDESTEEEKIKNGEKGFQEAKKPVETGEFGPSPSP